MTSESERTSKQARAIGAALEYANYYSNNGKSVTEYAADHEMTNKQAEELIKLGGELLR